VEAAVLCRREVRGGGRQGGAFRRTQLSHEKLRPQDGGMEAHVGETAQGSIPPTECAPPPARAVQSWPWGRSLRTSGQSSVSPLMPVPFLQLPPLLPVPLPLPVLCSDGPGGGV